MKSDKKIKEEINKDVNGIKILLTAIYLDTILLKKFFTVQVFILFWMCVAKM